MIYPIFIYGEETLKGENEEITDFQDPDLKKLISDMFETMRNANGVGLAAPQIGINKRIIIIEQNLSDNISNTNFNKVFSGVFINPKILNFFGSDMVFEEGCLSFPGIYGNVVRKDFIELAWYDETGEYHKEVFWGIKSRILQHEVDHINGILVNERFDVKSKLLTFLNIEKMINKNVSTKYPIV